MAQDADMTHNWLNGWRIAGWGALLALLALPAIAMQFTPEVEWTALDFVFAAVLLTALGMGVEIAIRVGRGAPQTLALIVATVAGFMTLWANAAVGFIGDEGSPVNPAFSAMAILAALATLALRFDARRLRWVYALLAAGQFLPGFAALKMMPGHAVEWGVLALFAALWSAAALLCHRAAMRRA